MTKQEEIREGIALRLYEASVKWTGLDTYPQWDETYDAIRDDWRRQADGYLSYLHSQGVVIKTGGIQEIIRGAADPIAYKADNIGISWERSAPCYKLFKDAGYVAVEPLISEVKSNGLQN
jgi:hypothetical protein